MNIPWEIPPTEDDIRHVLRLLGDQASHPVYIHCSKGIERSGIAIAIYRIELMGWTPDRAVRPMRLGLLVTPPHSAPKPGW